MKKILVIAMVLGLVGALTVMAQDVKPGKVEVIDLGKDVKLELVLIPAGKFKMGSPLTEKDRSHVTRKGNVKNDETQHEVTLTNPFYLGKYEVTQEQWESVMGDEILKIMPARARNPKYPMARLNWLDCQEFVKRMNKTGKGFRLPSEAEWEYACRAGTPTAYFFGDDIKKTEANIGFIEDKLSVVGAYKPNKFGLFDTHGNVAEWVLDQYVPDTYKLRAGSAAVDPLTIPMTEYPRIVRGGGWDDPAEMLRSAVREGSSEEWKQQDPQLPQSIWYFTDALGVGLRVVCTNICFGCFVGCIYI